MAKPCANLTWTNNSATGVTPPPDDLAIDRIRSIDFAHANAGGRETHTNGIVGDAFQDTDIVSHTADGPSGAGTHSGLDPMISAAGSGNNLDANGEGDDLSGDIDANQPNRPATQYYYGYRVATKRTASPPADINSYYLNGGSDLNASPAITKTGGSGVTIQGLFNVGSALYGYQYTYELMLFETKLSLTDMNTLRGYFGTKYPTITTTTFV